MGTVYKAGEIEAENGVNRAGDASVLVQNI
jgi:hypothetical protein